MKLTVREYSEIKKMTTGAVYQKIKSKKLKTEFENNITYIIIDENEPIEENINELKIKINLLQEENQRLKNEKTKSDEILQSERYKSEERERELQKRLHENNIIIMKSQENISNLTENIKAIEYKKTEIEEELFKEKSKTFWQKLFKV